MGYRLHVAEVYQVKPHSRDYFNDISSEDVNLMLLNYCPGLFWDGEGSVEFATHIEVPRTELVNFIAKIAGDRDGSKLTPLLCEAGVIRQMDNKSQTNNYSDGRPWWHGLQHTMMKEIDSMSEEEIKEMEEFGITPPMPPITTDV